MDGVARLVEMANLDLGPRCWLVGNVDITASTAAAAAYANGRKAALRQHVERIERLVRVGGGFSSP